MTDVRDLLRRLLSELDKEDEKALLDELKGKKLTSEELLEAIRNLPPEARKEVREALAEVKEDIEEEEEETTSTKKTKTKKTDDDDEETEEEETSTKSKRRVRPGRKSGRAYSWWIDEKTGEVVQLDIARVYSGPDEPDEVEMLPLDEEEDDENEDEEEVA